MRRIVLAAAALAACLSLPAASGDAEAPELYVAFEDRAGSDYDYNDFGMTMSAAETYDGDGVLRRVTLTFEAACLQGGDEHEVHVGRAFAPETRWALTLRRSRPAAGAEQPAGATEGRGDLDVLLFDTACARARDEVRLSVEILESHEPTASEPTAALDRYDPWLLNRTTGQAHHGDDRLAWRDGVSSVPSVLVLPAPGWQPPGEWSSVTDLYPDFEGWFVERDPACSRWYEVAPR